MKNAKKNSTPDTTETNNTEPKNAAPIESRDGSPVPPTPGDRDIGARALAKFRPRFSVIPPKECLQISLDVQTMVTGIVGPAARIATYKEQLAKLPNYDVETVCQLEEIGAALMEANQNAFGPELNHKIDVAVARAVPLREKFYVTFDMLAIFGFVSAAWIASLRAGSGYRDLAGDLISAKNKFMELPAEARAKTMITDEDCENAAAYANEIISIIAHRDAEWTGTERDPAREREQVYTFAMHIYEEARGGIQFIRRSEKDADDIAPSLFARPGRRPTTSSATTEPATTAAPDAPVNTPVKPADKAPVVQTTSTSPIPPAKNGGPFTA